MDGTNRDTADNGASVGITHAITDWAEAVDAPPTARCQWQIVQCVVVDAGVSVWSFVVV